MPVNSFFALTIYSHDIASFKMFYLLDITISIFKNTFALSFTTPIDYQENSFLKKNRFDKKPHLSP